MNILERDFLVYIIIRNQQLWYTCGCKQNKNRRKDMKGISKKINIPPRKKPSLSNLSNEIGQE